MVASMLPHAESVPNDHREDGPHFRELTILIKNYLVATQHKLLIGVLDGMRDFDFIVSLIKF